MKLGEEEDDEVDDDVLQEDVQDFKSKEIQRDVALMALLDRLSCFSHLLQLVAKIGRSEVPSICAKKVSLPDTCKQVKSYGEACITVPEEIKWRLPNKMEFHVPCHRMNASGEVEYYKKLNGII